MATFNACQRCGFDLAVGFRFCGNCGKPVKHYAGTSRLDITAERRNLIFVFCDLVGSSALAERLDPEDMLRVVNNYQTVCTDIVGNYGGHVAQYLGDGILIYFGYPCAQDNDAGRAVLCALDIQKAIANSGRIGEATIRARIAMHNGQVVVGPLAGQANGRALAIGEAPNLAARLQKLAAPGEVVVSESLRRLLAPEIVTQTMGVYQLKGIDKPIEVYRICGIDTAATRLKPQSNFLLGREQEQQQISERWRDAATGRPQMLLLRGEPGIGKSRLINAIKEQLAKEQVTMLAMACTPLTKDTAFFPIIELIRSRLQLYDLPLEKQLDKLYQFFGQVGLPAEASLPLLGRLLVGANSENLWPEQSLSPQRQRQLTMELFAELLRRLSSQSPLLLVLEDLHWADNSTLDLLRQCIYNFDQEPVLLIASARPEFNPSWLTSKNIYRIELGALSVLAASQLIYYIVGGSDWPIELVRVIRQRAGGNPLFLEEITRFVIECSLASADSNLALSTKQTIAELVPSSMESAMMARLDRLGQAKATVQIAAIIGREFSLPLLEAITKIDRLELLSCLEEAQAVGLLLSNGGHDNLFAFKHALIQDVACNSLLNSTRASYHELIADVIVADFADLALERPDVLAHHLSGAGRYLEAAWQWLEAGKASAKRGASVEALDQLQRGLADLAALSADPAQQECELMLLQELLPVKMVVYGWAAPRISSTCCRALELLQSLGRQDESYPFLWGLWSNRFVSGQLNQAEQTAMELQKIALNANVPMLSTTALHADSYTALYRGEFAKAIDGARKIVQDFDLNQELNIIGAFQLSSAVCMQKVVATSLWMQGRQQEAWGQAAEMVKFSRQLNHGPSYACALAFLLHFKAYACDWEGTIKTANRLSQVALTEGFDLWTALASMYRKAAMCYLNPGCLDKFLDARKSFRHTNAYCVEGTAAMFTTDLLVRHGRHGEALALNEESEELMLQWKIGLMLPELYRVRGHALWKLRQLDGAQAAYEQAVQCARGQGAWSLVLRALRALQLFMQAERRAPLTPALAELWYLADQNLQGDRDFCKPQLVNCLSAELQ
jgi:class 3 adenylate cyclase/tetratricopeptide (TPR) repeat protein